MVALIPFPYVTDLAVEIEGLSLHTIMRCVMSSSILHENPNPLTCTCQTPNPPGTQQIKGIGLSGEGGGLDMIGDALVQELWRSHTEDIIDARIGTHTAIPTRRSQWGR